MFLLVFAVPALLVVLLGYVAGHGLWSWIARRLDAALGTSLANGAEPAGWITGAVLLLGLVLAVVRLRRGRGTPWS